MPLTCYFRSCQDLQAYNFCCHLHQIDSSNIGCHGCYSQVTTSVKTYRYTVVSAVKSAWHMQAELLQQEIINRHRMSVAIQRLLDDLPHQAAAAEERMFMAEYVKGYQLVSLATCTAVALSRQMSCGPPYLHTTFLSKISRCILLSGNFVRQQQVSRI